MHEFPTPSRRSVVRTGVWAVPAVAVATAAPALAVSGPKTLTFNPGSSSVSKNAAGQWEFRFGGATVSVSGGGIAAGGLQLAVTFVPSAPYAANMLTAIMDMSGFAAPTAGTTSTSLTYTDSLSFAAGSQAVVPDGSYFRTAADDSIQRGTFVITASAPGFASAVYSAPAPTGDTLTFKPGSTTVSKRSDGTWGVDLKGASIVVSGGNVPAGLLKMAVTFVPDAGFTESRIDFTQPVGTPGLAWAGVALPPQPFTEIDYQYNVAVNASSGDQTVTLNDGTYWHTAFADTTEQGTFVLTFTAPGFASTTYRIHAPKTKSLAFKPGTTTVSRRGDGTWGVDLKGASVVVSGGTVASQNLVVKVTFVADSGFTQTGLNWPSPVTTPGLSWTEQPVGSAPAFSVINVVWGPSIDASVSDQTLAMTDGTYWITGQSDATQQGYFQLDVTAPGFPTTTYQLHAPKVPTLTFKPGTSSVARRGDGTWGLTFAGASVLASGGSIGGSQLHLKATFTPDAGTTANTLDVVGSLQTLGFNWFATYTPPLPTTLFDNWYGPSVTADTTDVSVPITNGTYWKTGASDATQQGWITLTMTAPGFASTTARYHVP